MARAKDILFRIFYSTSFTFVFLLLLVFICASPIDTIYQSLRRQRLIDIFLIAGTYIVTGLVATLIYSSRLYTNRSALKEIPKTYMPIEKDDLPTRRTSKFIAQMLARSAIIAYQAKPRSNRLEHELPNANDRIAAALRPELAKVEGNFHFAREQENIQHRGFSSPAASQLPDLEYAVVVAELVDLIEAKAVSLAPIDPMSTPALDGMPVPDDRVTAFLTRPNTSGMREYLNQLIELEVIPNTSLVIAFLSHYERARFGPLPLSESEFQTLMRMFAELLRSMKKPNVDALDLDAFSDDAGEEARDARDNGSFTSSSAASSVRKGIVTTTKATVENHSDRPGTGETASTFSESGSVLNKKLLDIPPSRVSEDSVPSRATDDDDNDNDNNNANNKVTRKMSKTKPRSRSGATAVSAHRRQSRVDASVNGSAARRPSLHQTHSQNSLASSLRSATSAKSRSGRSVRSAYSGASNTGSVVIRLTSDEEQSRAGALPFAIEMSSSDRGRGGSEEQVAS